MKKLIFFLMLAIAFASCDGFDPIDSLEVVKHTIVATYDDNVTISPVNVLVKNGGSATLDVITKTGYTSTVKVNGTIVSLTSPSLTLSNVVADMKIEATSTKINVKQYTITSTGDANVSVSPASAVVVYGQSATFDIITSTGYKSIVKVNGNVVSITNSLLTLSNVTSDMKIEATSTKIKQYTITATIDSNGTISPASTVVNEGKVIMNLFVRPNDGYVLDKFKVNGVEETFTPEMITFDNVNSDIKIEATTKEMTIDPYFYGIKWRMDSVYARVPGLAGYEEYSLYAPAYLADKVYYFFSSGHWIGKFYGEFFGGMVEYTIDKSKTPNILFWGGRYCKVEVRTNKKLVLSYIDNSYVPAEEFKTTYIPEP